ncbi:MAG: UDP-3-O-(3-hydroxymyristoyl)glucosamine N-acyltransferase [Ferruginibacter sp.]
MKKFSINQITSFISAYDLAGNKDCFVTNVRNINEANEDSLVWISPVKLNKQDLLNQTKGTVIICDNSLDTTNLKKYQCCIIVDNPKLEFLRIVNELFVPKTEPYIHPTAVIDTNAKIGLNVYIGPYTIIGKSIIGNNTFIESNCRIHDDVIIGNDVNIQSGVVIGAAGFGYSRKPNGESERFPHIGGVVIEDNVDIGANTCIDKGSLGNTWIKKGVKIDNLVHIAHNVIIGDDAYIIAHAMIGGSTIIGERAWIAPNAALRDNIIIGKNVIVGLGAIVTKNIPDDEVWMGNPAKKFEKK